MKLSETNGFVFDFDSTIVTVETFDEILRIALKDNPNRDQILPQIEQITNAGMNGEILLRESLTRRLQIASISHQHLEQCKQLVAASITGGMEKVIELLREQHQKVFIVSGGFTELILPVSKALQIPADHCYANTFEKVDGAVTGIDFNNPLANNGGKTITIENICEKYPDIKKIICIGDGMSDAEPYVAGKADEFWGFFQNKDRPKVREMASRSFDSSEELLEHLMSL